MYENEFNEIRQDLETYRSRKHDGIWDYKEPVKSDTVLSLLIDIEDLADDYEDSDLMYEIGTPISKIKQLLGLPPTMFNLN